MTPDSAVGVRAARRHAAWLGCVLALAVGVAACSDGDEGGGPSGGAGKAASGGDAGSTSGGDPATGPDTAAAADGEVAGDANAETLPSDGGADAQAGDQSAGDGSATPADSTAPSDTAAIADAPATGDDSATLADAAQLPGACTQDADCGPGLPCALAVCSIKGWCTTIAKADGGACSDGNACTVGDQCAGGVCAPGSGEPVCDDQNACTSDACNPFAGCVNLAKPASSACDDGNVCTVGDVCVGSACAGGVPVCQCQKQADCGAFEDGNACNGTLYCDVSVAPPYLCKVNPATLVICPSGLDNACQTNLCLPATGQCAHVAKPQNSPCDDGKACTVGDNCHSGQCQGGTDVCFCKADADCATQEDGNLCNGSLYCNKAKGACELNPATVVTCQTAQDTFCRKNLCNPKEGKCHLVAVNANQPCDDGTACTPNETCQQGACTAAVNTCDCQKDADCQAKDDGDACNGTLYCDVKAGKCKVNPATVVMCNTDDDPACLRDVCNSKTGQCAASPLPKDGTACDDGNPCTTADSCDKGACQSGQNLCPCDSNAACAVKEDGNLCNGTLYCDQKIKACAVNPATVVQCADAFDETCLANACNPVTGKCGMAPRLQGNTCTDGSACGAGGWCLMGVCALETKSVCECQADSDCAPFEDGNLCNGKLYCDKTTTKPLCKLDPKSVVVCKTLSDSACLSTQCVAATGVCVQSAINATCDDGLACTVADACAKGSCTGLPKDCTDTQPCTADSCLEPYGCVHPPGAPTTCDDGNSCTAGDVCTAGVCLGKPKVCDDGNPCTIDSCNASAGCAVSNGGGACTDNDPCTVGDGCKAGACAPGKATICDDKDFCTSDACDLVTGKCLFSVLPASQCNDNNACSDDSCAPDSGCTHLANAATCSDSNPCTVGEGCAAQACKGGAPLNCSDGNPCTDDACDAKTGCGHSPNTAQCSDSNACTTGDVCKGGSCAGKLAKTCNDSNVCTSDSCDPLSAGCVHTPTDLSCSDDNLCTELDHCKAGSCQGKAVPCDDGNDCTADSCDPAKGCTAKDAPGACTLPNCKADNVCQGGACVAGTKEALFDIEIPLGANAVGLEVFGNAVARLANGGLAVVGTHKLQPAGSNGGIWYFSPTGQVQATGTVGASARVVATVAGTPYVNYTGGGMAWTAAIGPTAAPISTVYQTHGTGGTGIADFKGGPVVAGYIASNGAVGYKVLSMTTKLDITWQWYAWGTVYENLLAVLSNPQGTQVVAVGATGKESHGVADAAVVRLTATGELIAEHAFGGPATDIANDLAQAAGGGFVVAGHTFSFGAGGSDGWLLRIDVDGKLLWHRTVGTAKSESFNNIVAHGPGYVAAGLAFNEADASQDSWLVGLDGNGNVQWERRFGGPGAQSAVDILAYGDGTLIGATADTKSRLFRRDAWGFTSCSEAGLCAGKGPGGCEDGNPCTVDTCSPTLGCQHAAVGVGTVCSDSKTCDTAGACTVPLGMRAVAAGPFWMGCAPTDLFCAEAEKPGRVVTLGAYLIDELEVTVDDYVICVKAGACVEPTTVYNTKTPNSANYGFAARGGHPVNFVRKQDAAAYCGWRGKRLPTEAEWERATRPACTGPDPKVCAAAAPLYPWGNLPADCLRAQFDSGTPGCGTKLTTTAGSRPTGASAAGVQDLAGNVAEWVSDGYDPDFYTKGSSVNPQAPQAAQSVLRGGGFATKGAGLRASARAAADNAFSALDVGFRCAK